MSEAWELLLELIIAERARLPAVAAELELSPMQLQVLRMLEPGHSVAMGRVACDLGCDASNVTGIVDRLEKRGLVERRPAQGDRRVKVLVITRAGTRVRRAAIDRLAQPPESIRRLSAEDQELLARLLQRALTSPRPAAASRGTAAPRRPRP
ncbi:MAG TPA: MarR family transcriptional regulator [Gaiellales bacterium]|jgi:DNA-binding MarR family transcriptional regulator|nr:MarR family transcriptional regulator [Gaiellales bacterium]